MLANFAFESLVREGEISSIKESSQVIVGDLVVVYVISDKIKILFYLEYKEEFVIINRKSGKNVFVVLNKTSCKIASHQLSNFV